ncbi:hypothetical protein BO221_39870 [Archangium sp. Cb G35]|uniref:hypothetical protein n=1 Tax=Archangium sp. Cb G35 TaxID=1920190 RepID=UPI0009358AD7|nr:hypothetical protein [Archangium sp. Cb G35]OJT18872.1 hypothetical protein BO221_39870 [Archangium sp. Cb G35]
MLLALALPFTASAENGGEIRNYIISINHLVENLDYELALSRIQLARQLPRSTDDEVTLSLYEGIILYELHKQGPATSVFRSALLLRPEAKLPVQVSPKVDTLFESIRKEVKRKVASLLPSSGTEKTSNKPEQKREAPPAPPSMTPALEKGEDTKIAQSPKEKPSSVEPKTPAAQVTKAESKLPPMAPAPTTLKAEQKKEEPVAVQPPKSPNCGPKPASVSRRNQKDHQLWRLAGMQHELCLSGKFQGVVANSLTELKARMEEATTSYERTLITKDIDQFASEFIYNDPQRRAAQLKAQQQQVERLKAEQQNAELRAAEAKLSEEERAKRLKEERLEGAQQEPKQREADTSRLGEAQQETESKQLKAERKQPQKRSADPNLDTSRCQPIVSADCEQLMQRLLSVQEEFLLTNPPSKLPAIRELVTIGKEIRAASTDEELQQASQALDDWEQRRLP